MPTASFNGQTHRYHFQGHFTAKKISEIWVIDPGKGGVIEFYGF
jgi:hypothetical protein